MTRVCLCTYSTGSQMVGEVLEDWLRFAGVHVDRVVVAVSAQGQPPPIYARLQAAGVIDELIVIPVRGRDVNDMDTVGIIAALGAAKRDYALLVKLDTLPYREGHEDWLAQAVARIQRDGYWGMVGSFRPREATPLGDGYARTRQFSNNFALVRPEAYIDAVRRRCGQWVMNPLSPAAAEMGFDRFDAERAVDQRLEQLDQDLLFREERLDWTVFHVNVWGDQLRRVRRRYLRRRGIKAHLNRTDRPQGRHRWQMYYGTAGPGLLKRARIRLGAWRRAALGAKA